MALIALEVLRVLMRWVHIVSGVLLIGGAAYARAAVSPAFEVLPLEDREEAWQRLALRYRPLIYAAIAGLIVSGVYNVLIHRGHSAYYLMWFAIKMLLAAHVFAAAILWTREADAKPADDAARDRRMSGILISGLLVLLVAAYLGIIY